MLQCSNLEDDMAQEAKPHNGLSPVSILTELAVEGASSFIEAQRILLTLAQQENEIITSAVKGQIAGSTPGVAIVDMARRSLDTFIKMHEDFLTSTSKQTMHWIEAVKHGKGYDVAHLTELAREEMEAFRHAQKKFLEVISEETAKATSGKPDHTTKTVLQEELPKLARDAANSFIEAQKRLLDVLGQQMNVNLGAATHAMDLLSPARFWPMAQRTGEGVKNFVEAEKKVFDSMTKPHKAPKVRRHKAHARRTVKAHPAHVTA
jgi:hypothetical protein